MKLLKVGDVSVQVRGVSYDKSVIRTEPINGYLPLLRGGNIGDHGLIWEDLQYVPESIVSANQLLRAGDVVLAASSGSLSAVGKAAKFDKVLPATFGAFCKTLRPAESVDAGYFGHYFRTTSYRRQVSSLAEGANINNLRKEHLDNLVIPLPPLNEQRRIAAILDKADELRTKRREALAYLDTLTQSIFHSMFGIDVASHIATSVGEVAEVQGGLQVTSKRDALPDRAPYLRVANVYRGWLDLNVIKEIGLTLAERQRTTLRPGDLLIVEGHGNPEEIGRCGLWSGEVAGCVHQNHLIRVRPDASRVDPVFMMHFLNSWRGRQFLLRAANTTSGLNTISTSTVRACPLIVPPLEIQQTFATRVAAVERLKETQRKHLAELDVLFASLQHRAFKGEL